MEISGLLLFFFSALGAFNGVLLTLYLLFSKPASLQKRLLAALLFVISVRISKSVWFYFNPEVGKQFLQIGLSACFLIGPFLYFYIASSQQKLDNLRLPWRWHLGGLLMALLIVGTLYPYQTYPELWGGIFYRIINWSWAAYVLLSAVVLSPKILQLTREKQYADRQDWLCLSVFIGCGVIWLAYFTAHYTSYIVGALSFSFVLYLSVLLWFLARKEKKHQAYGDKKIAKPLALKLTQQLQMLMTEQQLYKNPNLTLPVLAKKMQVSVPQLSQFLNDNLQKSFATYINQWRIDEACRLLRDNPSMTMDLIAENAGYNSQSTFYAAFKQFQGTTPARYRDELIS